MSTIDVYPVVVSTFQFLVCTVYGTLYTVYTVSNVYTFQAHKLTQMSTRGCIPVHLLVGVHCNVIECIVIECCIWWRCAVFIRKSWPGGPRPRHLLAPSHHFPCCHHHGDDDEDVDQYHDCQCQDSHKKEEHGDRGLKRGE